MAWRVALLALSLAALPARAQQPSAPADSAAGDSGAWRPRFSPRDPGRARLFLAPTARTMPRGQGYIGDYFVFFPVVGYGITDHILLSGGASVLPWLSFSQQLIYLAPKIGLVETPGFSFGVGGLYMRLLMTELVDAWGGVGYGVATFGGEDAAVTLGVGWPFASGGGTRELWAMAGGELRVDRSIKLLAEGWQFPGARVVPVVFGVRLMSEQTAVDLGLVRVLGSDTKGIGPWVDFTWKW